MFLFGASWHPQDKYNKIGHKKDINGGFFVLFFFFFWRPPPLPRGAPRPHSPALAPPDRPARAQPQHPLPAPRPQPATNFFSMLLYPGVSAPPPAPGRPARRRTAPPPTRLHTCIIFCLLLFIPLWSRVFLSLFLFFVFFPLLSHSWGPMFWLGAKNKQKPNKQSLFWGGGGDVISFFFLSFRAGGAGCFMRGRGGGIFQAGETKRKKCRETRF